jgi:hypothetical protein
MPFSIEALNLLHKDYCGALVIFCGFINGIVGICRFFKRIFEVLGTGKVARISD